MTRTRLSIIASTALASLLLSALPAMAQAPVAAPPPPAPAPETTSAVMPTAPLMPARNSDDMTGSVGLGVGVNAGAQTLIAPDTGNLMVKYWMSDVMAIVPRLQFLYSKTKDVDASWQLAPQVLASFVLLKGASTRLTAGAGFGFGIGKNLSGTAIVGGGDPTATQVQIFVPVELGVEHFFTRWFSMGIAANEHLIDFSKQGSPWNMTIRANSVSYMGSLFFYTD